MQLPKIVDLSVLFVTQAMPKLGISVNQDQQLLMDINRMWTRHEYVSPRTNMQRITGWEPLVDSYVLRPHVYYNTCDSLEQIANCRAQEILSTDRNIKFFWSGGIDSTFVLSYLLANIQNPAQMTIYHTCHSIKENPEYIDHIKKFKVKLESWSDLWETPFGPNDLIVTGTTADSITASVDETFHADYNGFFYKPWQDYFKFRGMPGDQIEQIEYKIGLHENSITTTLEARWWFYYSFRHQYWATKDWALNLENLGKNNVICFFDCYEFDAWSQVNRNEFFPDQLASNFNQYKQAFKNEIYRHWPNEDFRKNKTKVNSSDNLVWSRRKAAQFDQQYLFIYLDKNNQPRAFRPRNWPLFSTKTLLEDIENLNNEF